MNCINENSHKCIKNNLEIFMITHRQQVTDMIISAKVLKSIKWADVAKEIGLSKEWVTAACLGQMAFNKQQAEKIGQIFGTVANRDLSR
jgi:cyanate lyase